MNARKSFRTIYAAAIAIFVIAGLSCFAGPTLLFDMSSAAGRGTASDPVNAANRATAVPIVVGLNNPRGLNFGPDGQLYVAEAGTGGSVPCGTGPDNPPPPFFYGPTGSIARVNVNAGTFTRVVTGLPSRGRADGNGTLGPHDIVFRNRGNAIITVGLGTDPRLRTSICGPAGPSFDHLVRARINGTWTLDADIGAYEAAQNPDGNAIDSNAYGLLVDNGERQDEDFLGLYDEIKSKGGDTGDNDDENGNSTVLTDAGGNDLLSVASNRRISTLAVFPNRPVPGPGGSTVQMQAVPTTVIRGRDGRYLVGQLTGFPFPVGGANIYRVPARGGTPQVYLSGFTCIIDIAFGRDGSLYVLEIAKNGLLGALGPPFDFTGALIRVAPNGTRTELAPGTLIAPGGIAIGRDGAIYVTNKSVLNGLGEVVRITP